MYKLIFIDRVNQEHTPRCQTYDLLQDAEDEFAQKRKSCYLVAIWNMETMERVAEFCRDYQS